MYTSSYQNLNKFVFHCGQVASQGLSTESKALHELYEKSPGHELGVRECMKVLGSDVWVVRKRESWQMQCFSRKSQPRLSKFPHS